MSGANFLGLSLLVQNHGFINAYDFISFTDKMPSQWQNWIFFMFFNWNIGVNSEIFPMLMPNVKPQLPKNESYLCTGTVTDPTKELYITGFEPMVTMNQAHHLMVIGELETVQDFLINSL